MQSRYIPTAAMPAAAQTTGATFFFKKRQTWAQNNIQGRDKSRLADTGILDTELLQGACNGQEDTTQKPCPDIQFPV